MNVFLLLCAFVCRGLSYGSFEKNYGDTQYFMMPAKLDSIEFRPKYNSDVTISWKLGDSLGTADRKHKMINSYFTVYNLTQKDSGRYIMRNKDRRELSTSTLEVKAIERTYEQKPGEYFSFTYDLEPNSCNIYFIPENDPLREFNIVRRGRLLGFMDEFDCVGFDLLKPCGISNEALQMSCSGHYVIKDQNDDAAVMLLLEMEPLPDEKSPIGIGVGIFLSSLLCYCVKCCCCGKSSSKEDKSEPAAAEPDVHYQENGHEPVGPGQNQLTEPSTTQYPAQPSYTPTGPLIHSHPSVDAPPLYSELQFDHEPVGPGQNQLTEPSTTQYPTPPSYTATDPLIHNHPSVDAPPLYSEVSVPAEQADAPTVPVASDPVPQFELRGTSFPSAPLLSSDSTHSDVYTSDKFNFR